MIRCIRFVVAAVVSMMALSSYGQACTLNLTSGQDLQGTLTSAAVDSVICLGPGTYTGTLNGGSVYPANGGFAIGKRLIVKGTGATPGDVILQPNNRPGIDHLS